MYCKNCGKENADDAKFCLNCGSKLEKENLFDINKKDYIFEKEDVEKEEKKLSEEDLVNAIEYNEEELKDIANIELPKYGKAYSYVDKENFYRTKRYRLNHNVDLIAKGPFNIQNFAILSLLCTLGLFFYFVIIASDPEAKEKGNIFLTNLPLLISVIVLFFITIILFIIAGNKSKDRTAPLDLRTGRDAKAKLMKVYQNKNKYFIIFRYINFEEVHQTTQRVSVGAYEKLKIMEGRIIDIKKGIIGIYDDNEININNIIKKRSITITNRF